MLNDDIANQYHISCQYLGSFNKQHLFRNSDYLLLLVPLEDFHHSNIDELVKMTNHLEQMGVKRIGKVMPDKEGHWVSKINDDHVVLLSVSPIPIEENKPMAQQLAQFHQAGERLSFQALNDTPYDKWPEYWSWRIDQLEKWRDACIEDNDYSDFNHWFLTTYPYYMALAENAIQYAVDLRIDEGYQEVPTVCHHRFSENQWFEPLRMKKPNDWVVDHPSRDVAEWIRSIILREDNPIQTIRDVLYHYHTKREITPYSIKLIYSRLLFPIHYIETVEDYYSIHHKHSRQQMYQKLVFTLNKNTTYEHFLTHFPSLFNERIKTVDWLSKTRSRI